MLTYVYGTIYYNVHSIKHTVNNRAFAPHSDLLWMETAKPIIEEAREFALGVKAAFPHQMLAYNLSPSFNWDGVSALSLDTINTSSITSYATVSQSLHAVRCELLNHLCNYPVTTFITAVCYCSKVASI
jgi:isocitrate lyase